MLGNSGFGESNGLVIEIKNQYFKFLLIAFKGLGGFGKFEWFGGFRQ